MADWTSSMQQTFEYYEVDPLTWRDKRKLDTVTACSISYDMTDKTIATATLEVDEDLGECYVRAYLIVVQDGVRERIPLLTFLCQYTGDIFDGTHSSTSVECYAPLYELTEKQPALGYFTQSGSNILEASYLTMRENMRGPIVRPSGSAELGADFVANSDDTWLTFNLDLIDVAGYHLAYDDMMRTVYTPNVDLAAMQPKWTYTDNNASILRPDFTREKALYEIPNVVEVVYSGTYRTYTARAVNDDANSIVSTVHRGREIVKRITDATFAGEPTQQMVEQYAADKLAELSQLEVSITYKHGWNGVRVDDCVLMNNTLAGVTNVKAKVIAQSFECKSGIEVTETATYVIKYWR